MASNKVIQHKYVADSNQSLLELLPAKIDHVCKKEGEMVDQLEGIYVLETQKGYVGVVSPLDAKVISKLKYPGDTISADDRLFTLEYDPADESEEYPATQFLYIKLPDWKPQLQRHITEGTIRKPKSRKAAGKGVATEFGKSHANVYSILLFIAAVLIHFHDIGTIEIYSELPSPLPGYCYWIVILLGVWNWLEWFVQDKYNSSWSISLVTLIAAYAIWTTLFSSSNEISAGYWLIPLVLLFAYRYPVFFIGAALGIAAALYLSSQELDFGVYLLIIGIGGVLSNVISDNLPFDEERVLACIIMILASFIFFHLSVSSKDDNIVFDYVRAAIYDSSEMLVGDPLETTTEVAVEKLAIAPSQGEKLMQQGKYSKASKAFSDAAIAAGQLDDLDALEAMLNNQAKAMRGL